MLVDEFWHVDSRGETIFETWKMEDEDPRVLPPIFYLPSVLLNSVFPQSPPSFFSPCFPCFLLFIYFILLFSWFFFLIYRINE